MYIVHYTFNRFCNTDLLEALSCPNAKSQRTVQRLWMPPFCVSMENVFHFLLVSSKTILLKTLNATKIRIVACSPSAKDKTAGASL